MMSVYISEIRTGQKRKREGQPEDDSGHCGSRDEGRWGNSGSLPPSERHAEGFALGETSAYPQPYPSDQLNLQIRTDRDRTREVTFTSGDVTEPDVDDADN